MKGEKRPDPGRIAGFSLLTFHLSLQVAGFLSKLLGDDARMRRMAGHHHGEGVQVSSRKLTYEDFLLFPDDGQRHELIDGEHYVTPSPTIRH